MNAWDAPVAPLIDSRWPLPSPITLAVTPAFAALIWAAIPDSVASAVPIVIDTGLELPAVKVVVPLLSVDSLPNCSEKRAGTLNAVAGSTAVLVVAACAEASWLTTTVADRPASLPIPTGRSRSAR